MIRRWSSLLAVLNRSRDNGDSIDPDTATLAVKTRSKRLSPMGKTRIIRRMELVPTGEHDQNRFERLIPDETSRVYADYVI